MSMQPSLQSSAASLTQPDRLDIASRLDRDMLQLDQLNIGWASFTIWVCFCFILWRDRSIQNYLFVFLLKILLLFFRDFFVWILLYLKLLWPSLTCHIKTTSQRLSEISYYLENKKQKWEMQLEYSRLVARAVSRWIVFDGANGESNRRQKIFARIWPKTRRWQNQSVFLRNKLDCTRLKSTTWSVWSQLVSGIQVSYSQLYSR